MPVFSTDVREAKEIERLRFAKTFLLAGGGGKAAKRNQSGLVRMQLQRKLLQPFSHHVPETPGIGFVLEANHDIVRVAHDDHVAGGLTSSPTISPKIEDVV
jgi:hypothetical protein